jgi:hypothetical protein
VHVLWGAHQLSRVTFPLIVSNRVKRGLHTYTSSLHQSTQITRIRVDLIVDEMQHGDNVGIASSSKDTPVVATLRLHEIFT